MTQSSIKVAIVSGGTSGIGRAVALAYARERRQGRSVLSGEANAPIVDHPDVRRMLSVMKAKIAAARAICLSCGVAADLAVGGQSLGAGAVTSSSPGRTPQPPG